MPNVSAKTREHVLSVASEMGYRASPLAAALASGRTHTIGLLTPWVNRWFFSNVIEGAERALREVGYDVLLYSFAVSENGRTPRVDPDVLRRRVDGILVVGLPLEDTEVRSLETLGKPIVFIGSGSSDHPIVGIDDVRLSVEAVRYLLSMGHRNIGHITGTPDDLRRWTPPVDRRQGWLTALEEAGVEADPRWEEFGFFDIDGGKESARTRLERAPELTALFVASDEMAMGALLAARECGIRVPEELSIVGVDGHEISELVGLTTMSQPVVSQGATAAALVLDLIAGRPVDRRVVFDAELVVRGTTGLPRGGSLRMGGPGL